MNLIDTSSCVAGRFKFVAHTIDDSGEIISSRIAADWFDNLIVNQGLEAMGNTNSYLNACQVGTGSTAPNVLDTQLTTYLAGTATKQAVSSSTQIITTPYYVSLFITFRFPAGAAAGNLSEVGIGSLTTNGGLYSHALILDGNGSPTTISILGTEVLDVTYEHRCIAPTADITGNVTISSVNYSYTVRACGVNSANFTNGGGWGIPNTGTDFTDGVTATLMPVDTGTPPHRQRVYNGAIVAANAGDPTGTSANATSVSAASYIPGSLYAEGTQTYQLSNGNVAGGITAAKFSFGWCAYQVSFTPAIPKDATKVLTLTYRHSWTRATIP